MAVAFFFVLGGFGMTLGYKDRINQSSFSYKQFLTRRCIKFYPLHWLCLFAIIPFYLLSFRLWQIPVFFINATLFHSWVPIKAVYFSFNAVSWYLADTMFFALLFPLLFKRIVNSGRCGIITIAILFAIIYVMVAIILSEDKYHAVLYISLYMRLNDFVFGIYLALLYQKLKAEPVKWWNGSLTGQIIVLFFILLLVVESCILAENVRMIAPVYWILVGAVIITASFINGGDFAGKQIPATPW